MPNLVSKSNSEAAKNIWAEVDKAAQKSAERVYELALKKNTS